jgi:hypothetical protein
MKLTRPTKIAIIIFGLISLFIMGGILTMAVAKWFDSNKIIFTRPMEVKFNQPIRIVKRETEILKETLITSYPGEIDTPIKKYICDKFGPYDCKIALSIVAAESSFKEEAINVNTNGTVDFGCWQVNSIHLKKGILIKDLLDCQKATDWIYDNLYKTQGWTPWVVFNTGAFKAHL